MLYNTDAQARSPLRFLQSSPVDRQRATRLQRCTYLIHAQELSHLLIDLVHPLALPRLR